MFQKFVIVVNEQFEFNLIKSFDPWLPLVAQWALKTPHGSSVLQKHYAGGWHSC
jgi:hypothetical protein